MPTVNRLWAGLALVTVGVSIVAAIGATEIAAAQTGSGQSVAQLVVAMEAQIEVTRGVLTARESLNPIRGVGVVSGVAVGLVVGSGVAYIRGSR